MRESSKVSSFRAQVGKLICGGNPALGLFVYGSKLRKVFILLKWFGEKKKSKDKYLLTCENDMTFEFQCLYIKSSWNQPGSLVYTWSVAPFAL